MTTAQQSVGAQGRSRPPGSVSAVSAERLCELQAGPGA